MIELIKLYKATWLLLKHTDMHWPFAQVKAYRPQSSIVTEVDSVDSVDSVGSTELDGALVSTGVVSSRMLVSIYEKNRLEQKSKKNLLHNLFSEYFIKSFINLCSK